MSDVETPYVSINKVADYFQVSLSTVRKWVRLGQIPTDTYINVGGVYRFRLDDIEAALAAAPKGVPDDASQTTNDGE